MAHVKRSGLGTRDSEAAGPSPEPGVPTPESRLHLVHVSTEGFRAQRIFARMVGGALPAPEAATGARARSRQPATAPLDLAVEGDGLLRVDVPGAERPTD